jgi:ribosomal protein S18 acetylase RimI-like enzyme
MEPQVRFYVIEHPDQLQPLFASLSRLLELSATDDAILGIAKPLSAEQSQRWQSDLNAQLAEGVMKVLLAVDDQGEVCLCCMLKGSRQDTTRHIYDLQKGFIRPDLRGSGLLSQAMLHIANIARANGVDVLTLDVRGGSPAHRLWKAIGFRTYGILSDYSRYAGKSYAGYYMSITTEALLEQFGHKQQTAEIVE